MAESWDSVEMFFIFEARNRNVHECNGMRYCDVVSATT
jgi:hypothetical protein